MTQTKDPFVGPFYIYDNRQYSNPNLLDAQYSTFVSRPNLTTFNRKSYASDSFGNYTLDLEIHTPISDIDFDLRPYGESIYTTYLPQLAATDEKYMLSLWVSASVIATIQPSFEVIAQGMAVTQGSMTTIPHGTRSRIYGSVDIAQQALTTEHAYISIILPGLSSASISNIMFEKMIDGQDVPSMFNIVTDNISHIFSVSDTNTNQARFDASAIVTSSKGDTSMSTFAHSSSSSTGMYLQTLDSHLKPPIRNDYNGNILSTSFYSKSPKELIPVTSTSWFSASSRTAYDSGVGVWVSSSKIKSIISESHVIGNDLMPEKIYGNFIGTGVGNFSQSSILISANNTFGGEYEPDEPGDGAIMFDGENNRLRIFWNHDWRNITFDT